eukprot:SAG11_NODE_3416_length_2461_cov_24.168925_1_plen_104_part_00
MMLLADAPEDADERRRAVDTWHCGDVVGITELHTRAKHQLWAEDTGGRFICSKLPEKDDPAGGAGLINDSPKEREERCEQVAPKKEGELCGLELRVNSKVQTE